MSKRIPWNKGMKIDKPHWTKIASPEKIKKWLESRTASRRAKAGVLKASNPEAYESKRLATNTKISVSNLGQIPWNLGKPHSEETKRKISKNRTPFDVKKFKETNPEEYAKWLDKKIAVGKKNVVKAQAAMKLMKETEPERFALIAKKISDANRGRTYIFTAEHKAAIAKSKLGVPSPFKGIPRTEEYKARVKRACANRPRRTMPIGFGANISAMLVKRWKNPEFKNRVVKKIHKSLANRPTNLEKKFISFFSTNNLPFRYTGDGDVMIDGKNPDFVERSGRPVCLEVANKIQKVEFDRRCFVSPEDYENRRMEHFNNNGWLCWVIWDDELKNEAALAERLQNELNGYAVLNEGASLQDVDCNFSGIGVI